jgi:hypothetical protein
MKKITSIYIFLDDMNIIFYLFYYIYIISNGYPKKIKKKPGIPYQIIVLVQQ